jgi:hypothetical protein
MLGMPYQTKIYPTLLMKNGQISNMGLKYFFPETGVRGHWQEQKEINHYTKFLAKGDKSHTGK